MNSTKHYKYIYTLSWCIIHHESRTDKLTPCEGKTGKYGLELDGSGLTRSGLTSFKCYLN